MSVPPMSEALNKGPAPLRQPTYPHQCLYCGGQVGLGKPHLTLTSSTEETCTWYLHRACAPDFFRMCCGPTPEEMDAANAAASEAARKQRSQGDVLRAKLKARTRYAVFKRDRFTCKICGDTTREMTIDHIIPLSKGGTNDLNNLQCACRPCNSRKGSTL